MIFRVVKTPTLAQPTPYLRRNMYGGYEYAIKPNQLRLPYYFFEEKVLRGNGP